MLLGAVLPQEAAVEIVHQVTGAPVQLRADGGHEGRRKGRHHEPAQRRRQMIDHHPDVAGLRIL